MDVLTIEELDRVGDDLIRPSSMPAGDRRHLASKWPAHLSAPGFEVMGMVSSADRALQVFWRKGYEGASLADLTAAMGIAPPSLYAAFGNKEGLFRQALDRYAAGPGGYTREALMAPTARAAAERLLYGAADLRAEGRNPPGCLLVQGALSCSDAADRMRQELTARRTAGEAAIRQRFERAQADGDLAADADPADLARYVAAVIYGMAVQAAGGASGEHLRRIAEVALRAWPMS